MTLTKRHFSSPNPRFIDVCIGGFACHILIDDGMFDINHHVDGGQRFLFHVFNKSFMQKVSFSFKIQAEGSLSEAEEARRNFMRLAETLGLSVVYQSSSVYSEEELPEPEDTVSVGPKDKKSNGARDAGLMAQQWLERNRELLAQRPESLVVKARVNTDEFTFQVDDIWDLNSGQDPKAHSGEKRDLYWKRTSQGTPTVFVPAEVIAHIHSVLFERTFD